MINKSYAIVPNCDVRVSEGIITSLGKRGIPIIGLSSKPDCCAFHSKYLTKKILSPPSKKEDSFLDFLIKSVPKGVLFFSDDHTAMLFSEHREKLMREGFLMNLPSKESLRTGFDKWLCYQKALSVDLHCAYTRLIENENSLDGIRQSMPYPFIIKATTLAGGNYVKIRKPCEVIAAYEKMSELISRPENIPLHPRLLAQEWLHYQMEDIWCVEAYYDQMGKAKGFFPIKKARTVIYKDGTYGSRLYAGESMPNDILTESTHRLLDSLEWKGLAHLDWVYCRDKGQYYLTEINPRLPGFSFFPSQAGFEMGYYYYADLTGQAFECLHTDNTLYFETLRYPGDLSSAISACFRKQYSFLKLWRSYAKIFIEKKAVVIDYFNSKDIKMTVCNLFSIITTIFAEIRSIFHNKK